MKARLMVGCLAGPTVALMVVSKVGHLVYLMVDSTVQTMAASLVA